VRYRFLEDIATADSAFEASGKTPSELFTSAATALEEVQVSTKKVEAKDRVIEVPYSAVTAVSDVFIVDEREIGAAD